MKIAVYARFPEKKDFGFGSWISYSFITHKSAGSASVTAQGRVPQGWGDRFMFPHREHVFVVARCHQGPRSLMVLILHQPHKIHAGNVIFGIGGPEVLPILP